MKFLAILLAASLGAAPRTVKVEKKPDGRSHSGTVIMTDEKGDAAQTPKAWLGVSLGKVPDALATQLDVQGGVLVLNVVKDSPADQAGLQPHDIVVSVGGEEVGGEVGDLIKVLGTRQPGDAVNFVVLRDGQEKKISATLGERTDREPQTFMWKMQTGPDAEVEDQVRTRGHFLFKGPEGNWVMRDLGDLKDTGDLPDDVRMLLPDAENRSVQVFVENGEKRVRTKVTRDGETIAVEQSDDGPITVTRTDAQGKETSDTYDSKAELQKADEDAYAVLEGTHLGTFQFKIDGLNGGDLDFDADLGDVLQWHGQADMSQLHESLQRAQQAYQEALDQFRQLQDGSGKGAPMQKFFAGPMHGFGKPRQSFEVRTDGTIEVRVRKGDSELVKLYANENDLKRKEPELYEKYRDLMDSGE